MSLAAVARNYLRRYPADPVALRLREAFLRNAGERPRTGERVLIQCLEDAFYLGLFGELARALRARRGVSIELFVNNSVNATIGADWRASLMRSFPLHRLSTDQWVRTYDGIGDRVGYRSTSLGSPLADTIDGSRALSSWRSLPDESALETLTIDGMHVGDLVIDTYLRYRPAPRVDVGDPFLLYLLWQAHRDVRRARAYFKQHRPRLYLTSYTTYIQHGIATRAAVESAVATLSFGNLQEFAKRLTPEDTFHTRDPRPYKRAFLALDRREERLAEADRGLSLRLSGGVDSATAYMARSAYAGGAAALPEVRGAVVVFLHDFYDSPHVYADILFPDFWAWVTFTIETLQAAGLPFWLKPHPNQIAASAQVIADLTARHPGVRLLPVAATNKQLVEGGIGAAVTMYGTVAHEVAYLGVPSIACARHPHVAFGFCRTARSKDEYAALLRQSLTLTFDRAAARTEALEFYYMHNLALSSDARTLRDAKVAAWRECHQPGVAPQAIVDRFHELARLPAFERFIDALGDELGLER